MSDLIAHIQALNAKTIAWVNEDPKNRWAGILAEDEIHWNQQGIFTPEQFDDDSDCNNFYEYHKSVWGYKMPYGVIKSMTREERAAEWTALTREANRQREEQEEVTREREEANRPYEPKFIPMPTLADVWGAAR